MEPKNRIVLHLALAWALLVCACGGAPAPDPTEAPADPPSQTAAPAQPYLTASAGPGGPVGIVLETMAGGSYTYARIRAGQTEIWAAAPVCEVGVGDTVSLAGADNMGAFTSPSTGKSFDQIFFIDRLAAPGATVDGFAGKVLETMDVSDYTYVRVDPEGGGGDAWLAGPKTALHVGDSIRWQGGAVMRDFHSSTLDRTFARILFVDALTRVE